MKKIVRVLIFLMAFQMEVRVRAAGDVIEQPAECLKAISNCALQVTGSSFHFEKAEQKLHATAGSAVVMQSPQHWRLVKGSLWVEDGRGLEVETLFASFKASFGEYWVLQKDSRVLVRNMSASLKVTLRDGKVLDIPEGFELWISALNSKGQSDYGMIEPINMKEHLVLWNSLYRGGKDDFVREVRHYRENWGDLVQKSSRLYQHLTEREIASVNEKEQAAEARRQRKAAEDRQIKELYRQRVFER
ncbi:hypothetical protein EZJ49_10235 [Bdellovibrio bacteriovorus]|uniref:hypothetical protein n=1 Tax=Bdellovibrio bacteriovorus TaxID=959 RepID=UPI0021D2A7DB|nr:hypothetical protein [Bdellovibrio bacteriovorus]UXR63453.1 hypothetical protein EZJ49_10235 [Bdellovibrio bacteriovorus]